MNKHKPIKITKEDLRKIIYFILMKFRSDSVHMQGTSSKRDLIGGYIERWFNKIAETVVFDHILKDKSYKVVSDYFLYGIDSEKNAPDILGIEKKDKTVIPFVKFKNGKWITVNNRPRIEVKVVRDDQHLIGVREPQMIDDYYVFIESSLEGDYLSAIFEDKLFDKKYLDQLEISDKFVEEDKDGKLRKHEEMKKASNIGTMKLIGIYSKKELRGLTTLCSKGTKPYYFSGAVNVEKKKEENEGNLEIKDGICQYSYSDELYLPFDVNRVKKAKILKKNKGSVYIYIKNDAIIGGIIVKPGIVKIEFKKFDRSSNWDENISLKYFLKKKGEDSTKELVTLFDTLTRN